MPSTVVAPQRKLPVQQLWILAICRFAEPIASTSLFPYLPEMVRSFDVPEDDVAKWAGTCSAMFSIFQAFMGIPWGIFSDRYGRKIAILLGLSTTMITSLLWGFSTSLPMAITARALAGAGNGNVGIIRTTVAEMVPFKELQPRAFSLMPLVWNIGSVFGPMLGGALANPYNVEPGERTKDSNLFQRFPYALPNLVAAALFAVGIITGFLFLHETLETRRTRRDLGLITGRKITKALMALKERIFHPFIVHEHQDLENSGERQRLLTSEYDEASKIPPVTSKAPSYSEVLNKQAVLNLVVYTFLAAHTMGYDQLLPVFMHYPTLHSRSSSQAADNPLKFAGGLGLNHFRIGLISTAYGLCGMAAQFLLYPTVARRFGVLNCLKACAIAFPVAYFLTPFAALFPTQNTQIAAIFAIMLIKCAASIFAFPSSTILLTNSASSLRLLGTLNGIATSVSAVGRGLGPAIGGAVFTLGVKRGYVIAPWWLFCAIAVVSAIPVWLLVEGEGFGGDDDGHVSDEEEEEEEILIDEAALGGDAEGAGDARAAIIASDERADAGTEAPRRSVGQISRTTTVSSTMSLGSALSATDEEADQLSRVVTSGSTASRRGPAANRRTSTRVLRQMSNPIGTGRQGISRRYSSNLGQSFGSAGSYHGH